MVLYTKISDQTFLYIFPPLPLPVDSVYKLDVSLAACHQSQRAIGVKESATTLPFH